MAELQVGDIRQPQKTVPDRWMHVLPTAAFTFTAATQSHAPGSTSDTKPAATRPTDAQYPATKTLPVRQQHGLPTASFLSTAPNLIARAGSASGLEVGVTRPTDAQQTTKTLAAGALDQTDLVTEIGTQTTASEHSEARAEKFCGILFSAAYSRVFKSNPSERMRPIYDFTDPPRGATFLAFLSAEFWQVLDQCCEANAPCKILETELHGLEPHRSEGLINHMEEYLKRLSMNQISKRLSGGRQEGAAEVDVQPIICPEFTVDDFFEAARPGMRREKELQD